MTHTPDPNWYAVMAYWQRTVMNNEAFKGDLEPLQSRLQDAFVKTLKVRESLEFKKIINDFPGNDAFSQEGGPEILKDFYFRVAVRMGIPNAEIEHFVYHQDGHPEVARLRKIAVEKTLARIAKEKPAKEARKRARAQKRADRGQENPGHKGKEKQTGESSATGAANPFNSEESSGSDTETE
ncbi:hypothetical protein K491DRAFT_714512 [Lophiostoma macrostomum CBS 122681]|uniref:Uncharacterized protein n=1 Tax=Lophiostoma macrostomum CBS 122681 TaxID=1314788 RepID=A0A6A6TDU7_9PLEO|nr:hypothetical protein K491DRAFT_714512 [Lophiostoma macrostomum CBS 122681]